MLLPSPSLPVSVCSTFICMRAKAKSTGRGRGQRSPQGVVAGGIHRSLSSHWVIILVLFRQEWDGLCRARDEAPWPLEIHFHPAFISFSFSAGLKPALAPVQPESVITKPWSILREPTLSTNYKKAPQHMKNSSKQQQSTSPWQVKYKFSQKYSAAEWWKNNAEIEGEIF